MTEINTSTFVKRSPPKEMEPFIKNTSHIYPADNSTGSITVQWFHGRLNKLPFKWPVIDWPNNWRVDYFRFYDQNRIKESNPNLIFFVEDEASADTLISQGLFVTTIPAMGVNPNELDWSLFEGKDVIVWPDNYCKPNNRILEVINCIRFKEPESVNVVKYTSMLPENWNANLLIYEAQDNELLEYARENSVSMCEYLEELGKQGEFTHEDFWYPKFPIENHPNQAYA